MRYFWLLLIFISACAPRTWPPSPDLGPDMESALSASPDYSQQVLAHFSIHIQTRERTGRMLGELWGYPASVIRLDLSSSTGGVLAMVREAQDWWTAYLPSENKVYHDSEPQNGLAFFHLPIPFDTRQMASLLLGDFAPLLDNADYQSRLLDNNFLRLDFVHGQVAFIEISPTKDRVLLRGRQGWTLQCESPYSIQDFSAKRLYSKYTFLSVQGEKAVLRVKSLSAGKNWDIADLDLNLPQDVQWMRVINQ